MKQAFVVAQRMVILVGVLGLIASAAWWFLRSERDKPEDAAPPAPTKRADLGVHLLPMRDEDNWGFIDTSGTVRVPFRYRKVARFSQGRARVEDEQGQMSFIDETGATRSATYADALSYVEGRAAVADASGQWGFIDRDGAVVAPLRFSKVESFSEGRAVVWERRPGAPKAGYIDLSGAFVVEPSYDRASSYANGSASVGRGGLWGFVNREGRFVIAPEFDDARPFHEGLAAVRDREPGGGVGRWHFVRGDGTRVPEHADYEHVSDFSGGLAAVECPDSAHAFIDTSGAEVTGCDYGYMCPPLAGIAVGFRGVAQMVGRTCVWPDGAKAELITKTPLRKGADRVAIKDVKGGVALGAIRGRIRGPLLGKRFAYIGAFTDGLAIVVDERGWYGVVDDRGHLRMPLGPEQLVGVSEDWIRFVVEDKPCVRRHGAKSLNGQLLVEPRFAYLGPASEGLAPACTGRPTEFKLPASAPRGSCPNHRLDKCGYVDQSGEVQFWLDFDDYFTLHHLDSTLPELGEFHFGLAAAPDASGDWGYLTPTGAWAVAPQFSGAGAFGALGLAPAVERGSSEVLDREGRVVPATEPSKAPEPEATKRLTQDGQTKRWGYQDPNGQLVIEPRYVEAEAFFSGRAAVAIEVSGKKRWGIIDRAGNVIVPFELESTHMGYSEGVIGATKDGRAGLIDESGAWLVPPRYDSVNQMRNGYAQVIEAGRVGLVDRQGLEVLPPRFQGVGDVSEGLIAVRVASIQDGKQHENWGYVDFSGRYAVPPTLPAGPRIQQPGPFDRGIACAVVEAPGVEGYINRRGHVIASSDRKLCGVVSR